MQWNPDLLWQPIPVHSVPIESDYLLENNHNACPKLIELRKEALESDFITSNLDKHRSLIIKSFLKCNILYQEITSVPYFELREENQLSGRSGLAI